MASVTPIIKTSQLVLAHDANKYEHPSGNVYAFTKGGKGNHTMKTELFKMYNNRLLAELVFCLETRFSYWNNGFFGYIRPCGSLDKLNDDLRKKRKKGEVHTDIKPIMHEVGFSAPKTFQRLFKEVGERYDSATKYIDAATKFGEPKEDWPDGIAYYACWQNRMEHSTYFKRNDAYANAVMNALRIKAGLPHAK